MITCCCDETICAGDLSGSYGWIGSGYCHTHSAIPRCHFRRGWFVIIGRFYRASCLCDDTASSTTACSRAATGCSNHRSATISRTIRQAPCFGVAEPPQLGVDTLQGHTGHCISFGAFWLLLHSSVLYSAFRCHALKFSCSSSRVAVFIDDVLSAGFTVRERAQRREHRFVSLWSIQLTIAGA